MKFKLILVFLLFHLQNALFAQKNRFEGEILDFEKQDSIKMPLENSNLFVGSSSIRLWKTIGSDFDGYPIINRGFGGSNLLDLVAFTDRIVIKYSPAKIFIYSGENDLAGGITPEEVLQRFERVFLKIREKLPQVPIVFISLKPSIARVSQLPAQKITNQLIYNYLESQTKTQFVNIVGKMSLKGKPNPSLFITDKLHMNRRGYEIWIKKLKRYLVK